MDIERYLLQQRVKELEATVADILARIDATVSPPAEPLPSISEIVFDLLQKRELEAGVAPESPPKKKRGRPPKVKNGH